MSFGGKNTSSCSSRYNNPCKGKIVSPSKCNFDKLKLPENLRLDDDLRHSFDRLNNLRFVQEKNRLQNLNLNKFRKPSTNPNLEGIIKGSIINTHFYSTSSQILSSSQIPPKNPNSQTNYTKKLICYKCKKIGHYQNNCISDKNYRSQPFKNNSKLKTSNFHSEINLLKQEIKDIKTSNF